jgi:hypothetical protein
VGASCVTVNVWPAMVTVPLLCAAVLFAATVYPTLPLPVPLAPLLIVRKLAVLETAAVHAHPACVVTLTIPVVPAAAAVLLEVGEIENVQVAGGGVLEPDG